MMKVPNRFVNPSFVVCVYVDSVVRTHTSENDDGIPWCKTRESTKGQVRSACPPAIVGCIPKY